MNGKKKAIGIAVCILLTTAVFSGAAGKMMKETDVALLTTTVALPGVKGTIPQGCPPCMVSYWKLDEISGVITNDSCGENDGGILTDGDGNDPEWETGKVGNALHFAGDAPDTVIIADDPSFHFGTGDFALEAWIKYEGPTDGSVRYPAIMSKRPGPQGSDPIEGFCLCLSYWQGGTLGSLLVRIENTNYVPCSTPVDDGWHHVVVQRCQDQVQFYVDGQLDATATSTGDATTNAGLTLGLDRSSSYDTEWEGLIDEVAVYDCCLSSGTINCHYECGLTGEGYCTGTVHNIDTDKWYHWIQDAIDDAETNDNPGDHDTIEVYDPSPCCHPTGMYVENIVVNKSLTLRASNGAHPIIDGDGSGHVVTISNASGVEVSGFTIQNGGGRGVFIWAWAPHAIIKDNTIIDNGDSGIFIGSDYCLVENNKIASNLTGIKSGCSENTGCTILKNTIENNTFDGMHLLAISGFTITQNLITNNAFGIIFYEGSGGSCYNNLVIENRINSNANNGIGLFDSSNNNHIHSNEISDSEYGVEIRGYSNENEIKGNHIIDNGYGIRITDSTVIHNVIYNNYFDNTHNAIDNEYGVGTNTWNIGKTNEDDGEDYNIIGGDWFGGNYWSDYTGADDGSGNPPHDAVDGLGDTEVPYTCYGGIHNGGDDLPLVSSKEPPCVKITKKVRDPSTGQLVDNIEALIGTEVAFEITVCNCGTSDLQNIKVVDEIPDCLEYLDSEASLTIDDISISGNQVVWDFSSLTLHPGDCFDIKFKAKAVSKGDCENCAKVHAESQGESISDEDCVAVIVTPSGPCLGSTLLTGILALGVIALNRKKNR